MRVRMRRLFGRVVLRETTRHFVDRRPVVFGFGWGGVLGEGRHGTRHGYPRIPEDAGGGPGGFAQGPRSPSRTPRAFPRRGPRPAGRSCRHPAGGRGRRSPAPFRATGSPPANRALVAGGRFRG